MAGHDTNLDTNKARSVFAEKHALTLSQSAESLTPATIIAANGFYSNLSLRIHPTVSQAIQNLKSGGGLAATCGNNLNDFVSKLWASGSAGFGLMLLQIEEHIRIARELRNATDFIANTAYNDYGTSIGNIRSLITYGLDSEFGNLSLLANTIARTGKLFDTMDMTTFGQGAGLIHQLNNLKLANRTGINQSLLNNNIDLENLDDPVYKDTINSVLYSTANAAVVSTISQECEVSTVAQINSVGGLLDFDNYRIYDFGDNQGRFRTVTWVGNGQILTDFVGVGNKFTDLGAEFANVTVLANVLQKVQTIRQTQVGNLVSNTANLTTMVRNFMPTINNMIGTSIGSAAKQLPNVNDFVEAVAGGPNISAVASGSISSTEITRINNMITRAKNLMSQAGIDIDTPQPVSLSSIISVATSIHEWGANDSDSNIRAAVTAMTTNDVYGEAVRAALVEGYNRELLSKQGVAPFYFGV